MVADIQPVSPPATPRTRRITQQDVEAIARLVERRKLNESEACRTLGIKPNNWYVFKCRSKNTARFESLCARIRGEVISQAMERIEKAGEDMILEGPDGKPIIRRGDWRADHARLQLIAPDRFGDRSGATNNTQVNIVMSEARAQEIMDKIVRPQLAGAAPKQIEDAQVVDNVHGKENGPV